MKKAKKVVPKKAKRIKKKKQQESVFALNSPAFCEKCGARMEESIVPAEEFGFESFDVLDGEQLYVKKYECPKKSWWNDHDVWWDKLSKNL